MRKEKGEKKVTLCKLRRWSVACEIHAVAKKIALLLRRIRSYFKLQPRSATFSRYIAIFIDELRLGARVFDFQFLRPLSPSTVSTKTSAKFFFPLFFGEETTTQAFCVSSEGNFLHRRGILQALKGQKGFKIWSLKFSYGCQTWSLRQIQVRFLAGLQKKFLGAILKVKLKSTY